MRLSRSIFQFALTASITVSVANGYCLEPSELWAPVSSPDVVASCYFRISPDECAEEAIGELVRFDVTGTPATCQGTTYAACGFDDAELNCVDGEVVLQLGTLFVDTTCTAPEAEGILQESTTLSATVDGSAPTVTTIPTGISCSTCAYDCDSSWVGDSTCDPSCNVEACDYDGGDCANSDDEVTAPPTCAPGCLDGWPGDGYCDNACLVEACQMDKGDCGIEFVPQEESGGSVVVCSEGCNDEIWGNGECNEACNVEECDYDQDDCAVSDLTDPPTNADTIEPTEPTTTVEPTEPTTTVQPTEPTTTVEPTEPTTTVQPTEPTTTVQPTEPTTTVQPTEPTTTVQPTEQTTTVEPTEPTTTVQPTEPTTTAEPTDTDSNTQGRGDGSQENTPNASNNIGGVTAGVLVTVAIVGLAGYYIKNKAQTSNTQDDSELHGIDEKIPAEDIP